MKSTTYPSIDGYSIGECLLPPFDHVSYVSFFAHLNVGSNSYEKKRFAIHQHPILSHVHPTELLKEGGTLLTLYGNCFDNCWNGSCVILISDQISYFSDYTRRMAKLFQKQTD